MDTIILEKLLLTACESFIQNISKYNLFLLYEADFRCAIYAELVKTMEKKGMDEYPIFAEYRYGTSQADIALGDDGEIAIEIKFSVGDQYLRRYDLVEARHQLQKYLKNGAQRAYLLCLDHQIPTYRKGLSVIHLNEIGLSGEWKKINAPKISGDEFLIATLKKESTL